MEKTQTETPGEGPVQPRRLGLVPKVIIFLIVSLAVLSPSRWSHESSSLLINDPASKDVAQVNTFTWDKLKTKPYLDYTPCYEDESTKQKFQCARLELPMDYWNGTTNATISLAVIRLPADVPVTDPKYGGAVLLNPGGPGGSGVGLIQRGGKHVRETIDSADGKHYDLISFDPRAVGETKPEIRCMNSFDQAWAWQMRIQEEGSLEASDAALGRLWSLAWAHSGGCSLPLPDGEPDMRKYVTTPSVARDMLEIVEKHGEWREKEAEHLMRHANGCGRSRSLAASNVKVPEALVYKSGKEGIQYWGFSYGTYLGNTFAAMFPDRVHRLVVDGVVDAQNYKKMLWSDNLFDTEKDVDQFFYHCARVGYPTCALANETGKTNPSDVEHRLADLEKGLWHNPLPVISTEPDVITFSDIKNLIFASVYSPIQAFPYMATLLAGVAEGNGTEFAKLLKPYHSCQCNSKSSAAFSIMPLRNYTNSMAMSYDANMAIACSDGDDQSFLNKTAFASYAKKLAKASPSIGWLWSSVRLSCVNYKIRPGYRFEGPWIAKTSHPLLMIGNTADPVTPVRNAHKMAAGFEGAVALTQDSAGHCSSSAFSNCTVGYIRQYFQTGELPPVNTTCKPDEFPFGPGPEDVAAVSVELLQQRERHAGIHAALRAAGGF